MSDRYYTAEEAAAVLHCSVRHLLDGVRDGRFPGSKPGRRWVFTQADIEAIIDASRRPAAIPAKAKGMTARQKRRTA